MSHVSSLVQSILYLMYQYREELVITFATSKCVPPRNHDNYSTPGRFHSSTMTPHPSFRYQILAVGVAIQPHLRPPASVSLIRLFAL